MKLISQELILNTDNNIKIIFISKYLIYIIVWNYDISNGVNEIIKELLYSAPPPLKNNIDISGAI